jgi:4'-phosphopantetheinyl transferase
MEAPLITWSPAAATATLGSADVHIWAAPLVLPAEQFANFAATLAVDEQERAEKFRFERHRNRYIAGRGALREILGRYLQRKPATLRFIYSERGKPALDGPSDLHFNLAHSDNLALIAVTRAAPVGIDVERVRLVKDAADLVARFFSTRENEVFQSLAEDRKAAAFFNLWTRKEALLKATGEGIAGGLNQVEVSLLPGEPAKLLAIGGDTKKAEEWTLETFNPAEGFVGALAMPRRGVQLQCWRR